MRPVPSEIKYSFPPITYPDGRKSVCKIPQGYIQPALSTSDYHELSKEYGVELALVKAVMQVESCGSGFLLNEPAPARPKILFEAHLFYHATPKPVSRSRPDLSCPEWNQDLYKGGSAEWGRLLDAMEFDEVPALASASYGLGQVLGENYKLAGCASIQQFIQENFAGEYWQARHMMNYIVNTNLLDFLKQRNWAKFAYGYNGPLYWEHEYDKKLAAAYKEAVVVA
ncbi:MAG: N-acetylmuramidase family protein [Leptolyngbya sp. UWPOB_LEPTO1]|uniref:N-acetylmuramidase family protein n=1 Tax=Leptolyngbya sp. UWPOB_LEPTO1 TaxID=2815653 RepID=UPI001AD18B6D|nr:N-acetylmuramidase family protein [Leptolyngbya sp. UWPOB_LEPTO1]MBN8561047.1 N-acetylmuramidase family protein [Leptolyngbya sp. UWPOB_LEPTO1]